MAHRHMLSISLLVTLTMPLSGCLTGAIIDGRKTRVLSQARFASRCADLRVTEAMGSRHFKVEGCGETHVYTCHDRARPGHRWHSRASRGDRVVRTAGAIVGLVGLLATGGMDSDAPCFLQQSSRPQPREQWAPDEREDRRTARQLTRRRRAATASRAQSNCLSGVNPIGDLAGRVPCAAADEPGAAKSAPNHHAEPMRAVPSADELKQAVAWMASDVKECIRPGANIPRMVMVALELNGNGRATRATVQGPLDAGTKPCIEDTLKKIAVPPFASTRPLKIAMMVSLR